MNNTEKKKLLNLPFDILVKIGERLRTPDLFTFRMCSQLCKKVSNAALENRESMHSSDMDSFLVYLKHCRRLRKIYISIIELSDDLLWKLLHMNPLLEIVEMGECLGITSSGIMPLVKCNNLVSLKIEHTMIDDYFLEELTLHNNHLREVHFGGNSFTSTGTANFFANQPHIQYLRISMVEIREFYDDDNEYGMAREVIAFRVMSAITGNCADLRCLSIDMDDEAEMEGDIDSLIM